ncbi:hypothetical protein [Amycolatopsis kentuckyensis]|uniref:hypothetical protein n=1 Tax=Amycolatopsis kentuckyensis TaxID=218823 RepID=UPI0035673C1E
MLVKVGEDLGALKGFVGSQAEMDARVAARSVGQRIGGAELPAPDRAVGRERQRGGQPQRVVGLQRQDGRAVEVRCGRLADAGLILADGEEPEHPLVVERVHAEPDRLFCRIYGRGEDRIRAPPRTDDGGRPRHDLGHLRHRPEANDDRVPAGGPHVAGMGQPPEVGVLPAAERPISARQLMRRLNRLGIQARLSRNTALMDLAAQLPATVLSGLLNLHIGTATAWNELAGNTCSGYAAELSRGATGTGQAGHSG